MYFLFVCLDVITSVNKALASFKKEEVCVWGRGGGEKKEKEKQRTIRKRGVR